MGTLILVATALIAFFGTTHCGPENTQTLREFCLDILLQSKADTIMCSQKPSGHTMNGSKAAIISYLCCLGYFLDVNNKYKQFLSSDFDQYLVNVTSERQMPDIGKFVMMCKDKTKTLVTADYSYWCSNGKTPQVCFSR